MIFRNPKDEEKLAMVFRAYVEEWGPENIVVQVPKHWANYVLKPNPLGRIPIEFNAIDGINILVFFGEVQLKYNQPFDPGS